jgi:hypothetical protein
MRRMLLVAMTCLLSGHTVGEAQRRDPGVGAFGDPPGFVGFAETGQLLCLSWNPVLRPGEKLDTARYFNEATTYAWTYGFVVGAFYASEERLARIDAPSVNAWMDKYCSEHPRARIADAAARLIDELTRRP